MITLTSYIYSQNQYNQYIMHPLIPIEIYLLLFFFFFIVIVFVTIYKQLFFKHGKEGFRQSGFELYTTNLYSSL